ncbi:MAG: AI-2E family transporter [Casimicrobiaceae bacterium]
MAADELEAIKGRNARVIYALSVTALVLALAFALISVLHFLGRVHVVTTIIIGAVFFSYLVAPSVRMLRRRLPMWASVLSVYATIAIIVVALAWFGLPLVVAELKQFATDRPALAHAIQADLSMNGPLVASLPPSVRDYLSSLPAQISDIVAKNGFTLTSGALTIILSAASSLVLLILIPIFSAYAVMDGEWLRGAMFGAFPRSARPKVQEFVDALNAVLAGYIRGQLLVAACVGILVAVLLLLFHVKYAIAIGLLAGAFELVPYAGAIAGAIPGIGIALLTNGWQNAVFVGIGFVAINQLSGHVLSPLIVGDTVGIRPIFVLLALLVGGELAGVPGLLIAVPVAGVIRAIIVTFVPFDPTALPPTSQTSDRPKRWLRRPKTPKPEASPPPQ